MSEEELLQAVLDRPDEDAPRLAYADWCEQQEDIPTQARAEFLRLQIATARLGSAAINRGEAAFFQTRAFELSDAYRLLWAGPLVALVENFEFDRGFVELVTLSARAFLERADLLFGLAPIRHLNISHFADSPDRRDTAVEFFASPYLQTIRSLKLKRCGLTEAHLQLLAGSPEVSGLRWLSVDENDLELSAAEALAASPYLTNLAYVSFFGNPVDPTEQGSWDSGQLLSTWLPDEGRQLESRYGFLPWLHRDEADFYPSRFRL